MRWGVERASERAAVAVGTAKMTAAGVDTGPGGAEGPAATVSPNARRINNKTTVR